MIRTFKTNIERLIEELKIIEAELIALLDISRVWTRKPQSGVIWMGNPHNWTTPTEDQRRIQLKLLPKYTEWKSGFDVLFSEVSLDLAKQISKINEILLAYINQSNSSSRSSYAPGSITTAKNEVNYDVKELIKIMNLHTKPDRNYIVIPDVNSLLILKGWPDYQRLIQQDKILIVLTPTVLAELDELKINHRNPDVKENAKTIIRRIKGLRIQGSLNEGVTNNKSIKIKAIAKEPNFNKLFTWLDSTNNDDRIIASAVEIQKDFPADFVIVITADINLQNKAELAYLNYADPDM